MSVSQNEAIGIVHRFWWWAVKYAEDGDLRGFNDDDLAHTVGLDGQGKLFVEAMVDCGGEIKSGFIEREPYFRIHDWWDYAGKYLQGKYKHNPTEYKKVSRKYKGKTKSGKRADIVPPTLPNLTLPNITKQNQKKKKEKRAYGEFSHCLLTDEEQQKLVAKFGESGANEKITEFDLALESRKDLAKKYSSHYATILAWERKEKKNLVNGKPDKFEQAKQHLKEFMEKGNEPR